MTLELTEEEAVAFIAATKHAVVLCAGLGSTAEERQLMELAIRLTKAMHEERTKTDGD